MKLPTREEFIKANEEKLRLRDPWFGEPEYMCPHCGVGYMRQALHRVLTIHTYPTQYKYTYVCDKCGFEELM